MKDNWLLFSEQLLLTFEVITFMSEDNFWGVTSFIPTFHRDLLLPLIVTD